jgi:deoxyribodipyrimidine photo-lyase
MSTQVVSSRVPEVRIQVCNRAFARADGDFVLYWMIAFRRVQWNFALQRAVEWAVDLRRPLVIFEPLRVGYQWASDRLHRFIIDGMADNAAAVGAAKTRGVLYFPYVEPARDADQGLLVALAERACVVITDDYPAFFLPRMVAATSSRLPVRMEKIDSNGLLPLKSADHAFATAFSFRTFLQKEIRSHLEAFPEPDPLAGVKLPAIESLPGAITAHWPPASAALLAGDSAALAALPIDHFVSVVDQRGGCRAARAKLKEFLDEHLADYATGANHPDDDVRSGLSAHLHFGHLSPHEMFHELMSRERWSPARIGGNAARGKRSGWWSVSAGADAWLDQFVTWRELGYNMSVHCEDYDQYESLPDWSLRTLRKHTTDRREHIYSLDEFAAADTHDALWNAAQTQLLREGRIHNYLRMLWGKKILQWTAAPRDAIPIMIELNNRYALDGRDPNSYSGIFWCLGRYDRPWGPERPVFGTVRYMSSENTRKKLRVKKYLETYGARP